MVKLVVVCVVTSLVATAVRGADDAAVRQKMVAEITAAVEAKYQAKLDELSRRLDQKGGGGATAGGNVAVVDLQAVAKALGRDVQISEQMQKGQQALVADLLKLQKDAEAVIEAEKAKLGPAPTAEQQQALQKKAMELSQQLQARARETEQRVREMQARLLLAFREEVKPTAMKVAEGRGARVVAIAAEVFLGFDSTVDITADLIAALKAAGIGGGGLGASNMPVGPTLLPTEPAK